MARPSHHANDSQTLFQNPWPSATQSTWSKVSWSIPVSWYPAHIQLERAPIKVVSPDWGASKLTKVAGKECIVGTWLGHASALAEFRPADSPPGITSLYVLFDPIFSWRAGPNAWVGPGRFNKPPCSVKDLPGCDAVCISHNHFDHLDTSSVVQILEHFPASRWFVPLGIKSWLIETGVQSEKIHEMDWWDDWEGSEFPHGEHSSSLKFSCVPAQHTSVRKGFDHGVTLWSGWVVVQFVESSGAKARRCAVYHAGDTGYRPSASSDITCPAFKEIGNRFDGFDLSFIPIWRGGSLGWISYIGLRLHHHEIPTWNHCSPTDALLIHKDVKSRNTIAIHFGTFVGSQKESDEALGEFYSAIKDESIATLDDTASNETSRAGAVDIGDSFVVDIS